MRLDARGGHEALFWLIDGRLIGRAPPGKPLRYEFAEPGRYAITVTDLAGHYDRIEVSVR